MYELELSVALEASALASAYLRKEYAEFTAIPNAPASISTVADKGSQEIILQHILQRFPDDSFCAEEKTATLAKAPHTGERLWIVDPIDGTRGFAMKNGEFSVMIAFVDKGRIAVGVVQQPAVGRNTYAGLNAGCWRKDDRMSSPIRCQVTETAQLSIATLAQSRSHARVVTQESRSTSPAPQVVEEREVGGHFPSKSSRMRDALQVARIIESYSAGIKLALVARGEADIYLNTYDSFSDWDICAGDILVTEAGGRVTGVRGEELRYGLTGAHQKHGLLASNGRLHPSALGRLALAEV